LGRGDKKVMAKCPKCGKEAAKPEKSFKTRLFHIEAYTCKACGQRFKEFH
jgi:predicted RNA-binding Zn-ribbon protein involved in translation (DUF1610 family)